MTDISYNFITPLDECYHSNEMIKMKLQNSQVEPTCSNNTAMNNPVVNLIISQLSIFKIIKNISNQRLILGLSDTLHMAKLLLSDPSQEYSPKSMIESLKGI